MGRKREHTIDDSYFEKINNHKKAYILGFLYADGSIDKNGFSFGIHKRDVKILEFIKKELKTDYSIKTNCDPYIRFQIVSAKITKNLISLGIVRKKTYKSKKLPKISNSELFNSMLCGFFDGDGSIYSSKYKNRREEFGCCFSGNIWVLTQIKKHLNVNGISTGKIRYRHPTNYSCMLEIRGTYNIKKLFQLLYNNNDFMLSRKHNKFIEFSNNSKLLRQRISDEKINEIKIYYTSGLKQFEISEKMGIPKSTVRSIVQRLRKFRTFSSIVSLIIWFLNINSLYL